MSINYLFKTWLKSLLQISALFLFYGCQPEEVLTPVSVADFSKFVSETKYITDAEKYGWSIVQENVYQFRTEEGADWYKPDAVHPSQDNLPVTQVSYHDALAYCKWANTRLPNYQEYWNLAKKDKREIIKNTIAISPAQEVNIVGNVWDITTSENSRGEIRLAGGSLFCNPNSCNGTDPNRKLFVDKATGNIHIGFSVISKQ